MIRLLLYCFLLSQCFGEKNDDTWCEQMNMKTANLILNYQMTENVKYLDTALVYVNQSLEKIKGQKFRTLFAFRKVDILIKTHEYQQAANFVNSIDYELFKELSYYNKYLMCRIMAMEQQYKNNLEKRNVYLKLIIDDLNSFISKNEKKLRQMYISTDFNSILDNPFHFALIQYYSSKAVLDGYEATKKELDENATDMNGEFYDFILISMNSDFLDFTGY